MELLHRYLSMFDFSDDNLASVRELIANGLNPNEQGNFGFTSFHRAVNISDDNIGVIQAFINAGADANINTHLGYTPLHFAVFQRKLRVFEALIHLGASVNAKTFLGSTALHFAVKRSYTFSEPNISIIKTLLKHDDIDCNLVDCNGNTPLLVAVKEQQAEAVVELMCNYVNPNICNNASETPLHVAFSQPPSSVEFQLLLKGASIYSLDKEGQTPIDIFIKTGVGRRSTVWVRLIMKIIAFKYCVTNDLKKLFGRFYILSRFFNKCCDEVDQMRRDFITGDVTVHDFACNCFNENCFENVIVQIYKPVIDRLVRGSYSKYVFEILKIFPRSSLITLLEINASLKLDTKENVKNLADVLSKIDLLHIISEYLSFFDILSLLFALSDVKLRKVFNNFDECNCFNATELN